MADVLRGEAPAKVNLVLEVLGKRPDGYHEIDTILQELELSDTVEVEVGAPWSISVSGETAAGTPADDSNLALRAARLFLDRFEPGGSAAIRLEKRIPAASGLGGGASDAATVLKLLQWRLPAASRDDLLVLGNGLGSDEAFFLEGGTARAQGRGELVTRLKGLAQHDVVLFIPPATIERKTARMFAALDRLPFDTGTVAQQFAERQRQSLSSADVFNAFERVAFELFPGLVGLWEDLETRIGEPVRLAGAGPTLFWIGPSGGTEVARAAEGAACSVVSTRTAGPR
jgi:4-diphosphocytidyl-2-C-methyl-D-erythritol kinase